MESKIKVKQLSDHIYAMDDQGATGYVVLGNEKALVIDTMNASEDLHGVVRSITDLPIMVVNTHGHCDHILGNVYFEEAYLHPELTETDADYNWFGGIAKQHVFGEGKVICYTPEKLK